MTVPTSDPNSTEAPKRSWREIVIDCLVGLRGKTVPMEAIYQRVLQHPDAIARATSNKHVRAKLRQTLARLHDLGIVETRGPGSWFIPANLDLIDATYR